MFNYIEIIFIFLAASVWATGELIARWRNELPNCILQSYLYGSFAYRGKQSTFLQYLELPKSTFRHFYVFASILSSIALCLMFLAYNKRIAYSFINGTLSYILQQDKPSVCVTASVCSMLLLTLQIYRRAYETQLLQVFASHSRINLSHYFAGFAHYLGCIVTVVGQAPIFAGSRNIQWLDTYTSIVMLPCCVVFLKAWHEQYRTNIIFSNMRRDKSSGSVVTEDHGVPQGRWFEVVSSPHRLMEVIMYTSLLVLFPTRTFFCIYLWVLFNQIQTAVLAHQWYQTTFKNYPKQRRAIFPNIL